MIEAQSAIGESWNRNRASRKENHQVLGLKRAFLRYGQRYNRKLKWYCRN